MAASLILKLGDTYPPVETVLESTVSGAFAPIDLTSAEKIYFIMKLLGIPVLKQECVKPGGGFDSSGLVVYKWKTGETATVGLYRVEYEIRWTGGGIQSVPNENYDTIEIQEDLG